MKHQGNIYLHLGDGSKHPANVIAKNPQDPRKTVIILTKTGKKMSVNNYQLKS